MATTVEDLPIPPNLRGTMITHHNEDHGVTNTQGISSQSATALCLVPQRRKRRTSTSARPVAAEAVQAASEPTLLVATGADDHEQEDKIGIQSKRRSIKRKSPKRGLKNRRGFKIRGSIEDCVCTSGTDAVSTHARRQSYQEIEGDILAVHRDDIQQAAAAWKEPDSLCDSNHQVSIQQHERRVVENTANPTLDPTDPIEISSKCIDGTLVSLRKDEKELSSRMDTSSSSHQAMPKNRRRSIELQNVKALAKSLDEEERQLKRHAMRRKSQHDKEMHASSQEDVDIVIPPTEASQEDLDIAIPPTEASQEGTCIVLTPTEYVDDGAHARLSSSEFMSWDGFDNERQPQENPRASGDGRRRSSRREFPTEKFGSSTSTRRRSSDTETRRNRLSTSRTERKRKGLDRRGPLGNTANISPVNAIESSEKKHRRRSSQAFLAQKFGSTAAVSLDDNPAADFEDLESNEDISFSDDEGDNPVRERPAINGSAILVEASLVDDSTEGGDEDQENPAGDIIVADVLKIERTPNSRTTRRRFWIGLIVVFLSLVAIVSGVCMNGACSSSGSNADTMPAANTNTDSPSPQPSTTSPSFRPSITPSTSPSMSPSMSPTFSYDEKDRYLMSILPDYTLETLQSNSDDPKLPQRLAINWVVENAVFEAREDDWGDWRLLQIFALVCFYYAMGGGEIWYAREQDMYLKLDERTTECIWGRQNKFEEFRNGCEGDRFTRLFLYGGEYYEGVSKTYAEYLPMEVALLPGLEKLSILDFYLDVPLSNLLPSTLGSMRNLEEVGWTNNLLHGPIPENTFDLLRRVSYLSLANNRLTGTIPSSVGRLRNVVNLELEGNLLVGRIPSEIGLLTTLNYLDIGGNAFTGMLPSEVGMLMGLKELRMGENAMAGTLPTGLCSLRSLTKLEVDCSAVACPDACSVCTCNS
ncbi:Leucine Rich Repeat [Seminavis robusta]|uniref:Leucine Rich Repeat n=1 Tax=Seminavis robusta TaxID=568900 RepID=A0A9N8HZ16_9STRA|nr:Leucine Rich Repeat [Seminavis robusta]|eukprot:Sro2145_g316380.1 Leucine Rich Repeat (927) ;mRNA; r:13819-16599